VTVIHEVPVIEVTVIELPTSKSGATMEAATGKTTHMATHATGAESAHMTAKPATSHMATESATAPAD
jgi:hypothetical protein